MPIDFRISFALMYYAAGLLLAVALFVYGDDEEYGWQPLYRFAPTELAWSFVGAAIWPCLIVAAAAGAMCAGPRRARGGGSR